jgi:exopolysaccharide biosynthesis polyprenyl glycosylphosphotransferase
MSITLRQEESTSSTHVVAPIPPVAAAEPWIQRRAFRGALFTARWKRGVGAIGRIAVVALPVAGLAYPSKLAVAPATALSLLMIVLWWVALRLAARTTLYVLGSAVAVALGATIGLQLVAALALWVPQLSLSAVVLLKVWGLVFLFATGWEGVVQKYLTRPQKVLVVGASEAACEVADEADRAVESGFEVVGVLTDPARAPHGVPRLLGGLADLSEVVDAQQPDLVVIADADPGWAVDRLFETSWRGFRVVSISHFFEHAFGRVPLAHISPAWFMSILHLRQRSYAGWSKRTFDVTVAAIGLVVMAPVFVVIALAIWLSGKPVIFRQIRLGERGRAFQMYKFRTMVLPAEADGTARWAEERDPRATRVGRFLRRTRLDELPQLWNVIRGEMSIVGPRPERPEFVRVLEETVPFWNRRLLVKPGITGWAQIRSGYAADRASTIQKLSYDLWYVRHRTLLLDLAICAKTFLTVVSGAGAR